MSRWWPFGKRETRDSGGDFSDAVLRLIESQAAGTAADASSTAAIEAASGALSRAFASAEVVGASWVQDAVSPAFLAQVGRDLIRSGDSLHVIDVSGMGEVSLLPCSSWHFEGDAHPESWSVRATFYGPSTSTTRHLPYEGVVFVRWGVKPGQPYVGVGPTSWAHTTARLQSETERSLADEVGGPVAQIAVVPGQAARSGSGDDEVDPLRMLRADITAARGKSLVLEDMASMRSDANMAKAWAFDRMGPQPPDAMSKIMEQSFMSVLAATGTPPSLFTDSDGTSQREAVRRWHQNVIVPHAKILEHELTMKLETQVKLKFDSYALDMVSRAQVISKLVQAGVDVGVAMMAVGLAQE